MKLHFISQDDPLMAAAANSLAVSHDVSHGDAGLDKTYDGLVVGKSTPDDHSLLHTAREIGVNVFTLPELVYQLCLDKQRIVIAGSKGNETLAACVLHVLAHVGKEFDYFLDSGQSEDIQLTEAPIILIQSTANRSSGYDDQPQFLKLNHHIAVITELEHQFEDLYPTFEDYVKSFDQLADATPKSGTIIYCEEDHLVTVIGGKERDDVKAIPYNAFPGKYEGGMALLAIGDDTVKVKVAGEKDLLSIGGAFALLRRLSVSEEQFKAAIGSFEVS